MQNVSIFAESSLLFLIMGTKRKYALDSNKNAKKPSGFWALGLVEAMKDPELVVEEDKLIVIIQDKYAKAEHHFLVLPRENISNLKKINGNHLELIKHMDKMGQNISKKYPHRKFKLGYHAEASMTRLHLHVISDDFNSPSLKTKKHWNSFTTEFFIPSRSIIAELETSGKVTPMPSEKIKMLMNKDLKCHKCTFLAASMPKLKHHLLTHI